MWKKSVAIARRHRTLAGVLWFALRDRYSSCMPVATWLVLRGLTAIERL